MFFNKFTFDGFFSFGNILTVLIALCVFVVIISVVVVGWFNHNNPESRQSTVSSLIWVIMTAFVIGSAATIVKSLCGI